MDSPAISAAPAIATEHLTRRFGDLVAVQDVNLRVAPGQFFGFLGPNGAGKSTTIKMLTGLLAASSGRMEILGVDLAQNSVEVKRQIGVVPEGMALFGRLTGSEYLNFVGRMYGLDRMTSRETHRRIAGLHAAGGPAENAGDRLFARHAEKTGAGRRGDSWA